MNNVTPIKNLDGLLEAMWQDYTAMNPQARRIHELFTARGETVVNDHIALRTFNLPRVNIDVLAHAFVRSGYHPCGNYEFPAKKLVARHYEAEGRPKVFISELRVELLDEEEQSIVAHLVQSVDASLPGRLDFCVTGRPWNLTFDMYERLQRGSEYAAWVAAFGYRPNHFTVLVNALRTFSSLEEVNLFLEGEGFLLNDSGGKIKGSPEALLEQSSVLANNIDVAFSDGTHRIPGCYYEFARRYESEPGKLYQGFIAKSADRIFESTDRGQ